MPNPFRSDFPRKQVVREKWDKPVLAFCAERWQSKYLYLGLPGPHAFDVELWRNWIHRVIAFEVENPRSAEPREDIVELRRNLTRLGIRHSVFVGPLEEVVLDHEDYDGQKFAPDEVITLFNLDFCTSITSLVETRAGKKRLRFEVIRELMAMQRWLFRETGARRFIILLTVRNEFHKSEMDVFLNSPDLPEEIKAFSETKRAFTRDATDDGNMGRNTDLLRAYLFHCLRVCFRGQNVRSVFLPALSYLGKTKNSPMLHSVIVCEMADQAAAIVTDAQTSSSFLELGIIRAVDDGLRPFDFDPVAFVRNIGAG